jgi:mRNA interferase MazF
MVTKQYIPEQGDIVWIDFNPTKGHEQHGKRPAIILSRKEYNKATGLAVVCPITSQVKGYPFEVAVNTEKIQGAILADQVRSIDWKDRKVSFIIKCDTPLLEETKEKLSTLIR